jgi:hypothetical protein
MSKLLFLTITICLLASCNTQRYMGSNYAGNSPDSLITESLFNDKTATITEENIQKILDGNYKLPQQLRVAIIRLETPTQQRNFTRFYWNDEQYLKTQQAYLDLFTAKFKQSNRVITVASIPDLLISKSPSFTNIREAAVRMQCDVVVAYSITSDIYSKYKLFSKTEVKAYATTQLILLDVRTGLIPFSAIATKDALGQRTKEELDNTEATARIQKEAVLLTIQEISNKIKEFLNK